MLDRAVLNMEIQKQGNETCKVLSGDGLIRAYIIL
jgi:hypothetical protein